MRRAWVTAFLYLVASVALAGECRLADVFGDHMVLQREKAAAVWGTADAGTRITVVFAGQAKEATADVKGRWQVRLDPMPANAEGQTLTVRAGDTVVAEIRDVLVGDVWICGGQSNMGRAVSASWRPEQLSLDQPAIRFFRMMNPGRKYPETRLLPVEPEARNRNPATPNAWNRCITNTTPGCCAEGFFFAELIHAKTGIPQGLLWNAVGGSTVREWTPRFGWWLEPSLEKTAREIDRWYPETEIGHAAFTDALAEIRAWREQAIEAVNAGTPFPFPQPRLPEPTDPQGRGRGTTLLYNGRSHPLVPFTISGIIWHQGESDYANREYREQLQAMVAAWRQLHAAPDEDPNDLCFLYVQMQLCGSYMSPQVRDFQYHHYWTIPNAGMAVLLDLDRDLHPRNKYDAGRRMALWALAKKYGEDITYSGPIYKSHRTEDNTVVVEFDFTHGGLFIGAKHELEPVKPLEGGELTQIEITSDGNEWVMARSRIEGETLVVRADGVENPIDVRYCWKSKADGPFLYNKASLPAGQFNTQTIRAILGGAK